MTPSWGPEAVLRGASERLMPILMTATVTGPGLLRLALGTGEAGREIEGPRAIMILGSLRRGTGAYGRPHPYERRQGLV